MIKLKNYTLLLALLILFVCCDEPEETITPVINIISGQNQQTPAGQTLANPIVIQVLDEDQNPLPNIDVRFQIILGGGELNNNGRTFTDAQGYAQTEWTIGNGENHILKAYLPEHSSSIIPSYVYANTSLTLVTQWISDIEYYYYSQRLEHDNIILQSNNILVFSLLCSHDAKIILNKIAEESLDEILNALGINTVAEIGINPEDNNTKLHLFSKREPGGTASPDGLIVCGYYSGYTRGRFRQIVKHELTHVVQFRIGIEYPWTPTWFVDGFAEYISGGAFVPVENLEEVNEWREDPDHFNPLRIKTINDYPIPIVRHSEYYPFYGLAIRYLMDENGLGKNVSDIMNMFRDMVDLHMTFTDAFEKHMGISLQYYEDNFWELITEYLSKESSNP